jgi:hypothetical protein
MKQNSTTMLEKSSVCFLGHYEISPEDLAAFNRQIAEEDRRRRTGRKLARSGQRLDLHPEPLLVEGSL